MEVLSRLRFSTSKMSKLMYQYAEFMHYVPFKYVASTKEPNWILPTRNTKTYTKFALFSFILLSFFICVAYSEAFDSKVTQFEFLFFIGSNCIYGVMNLCQWFMLHPQSRNSAVRVMNAVLHRRYHESQVDTIPLKLASLVFSLSSIGYSVLFFPILVAVDSYLPAMFHAYHGAANWFSLMISFEHVQVATVVAFSLRMFVFALLSAALGQGTMNFTIFSLWILTYLISTVQSIEALLSKR